MLQRKHPINSKCAVSLSFGYKMYLDFPLALGAVFLFWIIYFLPQRYSFSLTLPFPDLCLSTNIQTWFLTGHIMKVEAGDFFL